MFIVELSEEFGYWLTTIYIFGSVLLLRSEHSIGITVCCSLVTGMIGRAQRITVPFHMDAVVSMLNSGFRLHRLIFNKFHEFQSDFTSKFHSSSPPPNLILVRSVGQPVTACSHDLEHINTAFSDDSPPKQSKPSTINLTLPHSKPLEFKSLQTTHQYGTKNRIVQHLHLQGVEAGAPRNGSVQEGDGSVELLRRRPVRAHLL